MDTFSPVCPSVRYGIDPLGFALPLPGIVLSVAIANFALAAATAAAVATSLRKFRRSMIQSLFSRWHEEKRSAKAFGPCGMNPTSGHANLVLITVKSNAL